MNRPLDPAFDQRLADWLEDDPSIAPREVLGTVLAAFPSIDQRRASRAPWRNPPMNRYALPLAAALVVVIGAFLVLRPASQVGPAATPSPSVAPASIEGTWDVAYTRQELLAAGADPSEDNPDNYGHFHLTFQGGWWRMDMLSPRLVPGGTATYTTDGSVARIYSPADNVTFDIPYTVTATTLTFQGGGPTTVRVKPWTRVVTEVITATPFPADIAAYRQARNAVCAALLQESMPPDADPVKDPAGAKVALQAVIARANEAITRLSAMTVPASIKAEHDATIQATRDTIPLLQQEITLINGGNPDQVAAIDQQTAPYSEIVQQFEQKYGLQGCP